MPFFHPAIDALAPLADSIDLSFIHGSMAKGTETAGSDIDLLVVGTADFGSIVDLLHGIEKKVGREVNPKVFSRREWRSKLKAKDAFVTEILKGPKSC